MKMMKMLIGGFVIAAALLTGASANAQYIARDDASQDAYTNGWDASDNGGSGFATWQTPGATGGAGGFNGFFVNTPSDPGFTMANYAPMLTSNKAFSIYAGGNPGAFQDARRGFNAPLNVGNKLKASLAITFDNGNKGLNLYAGTNEVFNFNINNTGYSWSGGGSAAPTDWTSRSNGVLINLEFVQRASTIAYSISSPQGLSASGSVVSAKVDGMKFYISGAGDGDPGNLFFNNLMIETGTPPSFAFTSGVSNPTNTGSIAFTLTRDPNNVADEIIVSSDNPAAVSVVSPVTFGSGESTLTFTGTVVSLSAGSAKITAEDPASFATDEFTVTIPLPVLSIAGPGGVLIGSTNTYTVTRSGFVGSNVTISSSNAGILNPTTTNLVFEGGSNSVSFTAVAITNGSATLRAFGDVVTSAVFGVTVVSLPPTPTNVYDDATFYPLGWPNGSNGGNGFTAWFLNSFNGGSYIGAASNQAINNVALDTSGASFGLYANGFSESSRGLVNPLGVGDVLTFSMALRNDDGNRGFDLFAGGGPAVFNFNINNAGYQWTGGGTNPPTPWQDALTNSIRENGVVLDVVITATPSGFNYNISSVQDTNLLVAGAIASAPVSGFKFYVSGTPGGTGNDFFFNKLSVTRSTTPFLGLTGPANALDVATPIYTLMRNSTSLVADVVQLASSSTNAAEVPASVTFGAGQLTTTFRLDTKAAGVTTLTATNSSASAAPLAVTVTAGPTNIHDLASYYFGDWRNSDNNGRGFGAWSFNHTQGDGGFSGSFIGNPASAGIAGMPTESFVLYANPSNANAEASRTMPALAVGDRLSFVWGLNFDSGSASSFRGFSISSTTNELFNISMSDSAEIRLGTNTMLSTYGTNAITLTITHETAGNLRVTATGRDGVESFNSSLIPVAGAPDSFKFYLNASTPGNERQMYFNNFAITNVGTGGPVVLPPGTENTTASAITMISGRPNVSVLSTSNLFYYLVSPTGALTQVTASPVNLSQWTVVTNAVGTGGPITLIDSGSTTNVRYYGILIRSEALPQ